MRPARCRSVDMLFRRERGVSTDDSLDCTLGGSRFLRDRLILMCKVFGFINLIYFALFTYALSLDSDASYFTLATQSFSLETLGEYALFAIIYLACRVFGDNLRVLRWLDAALLLGLGCLWSSWCFIHPYPALGAYEMTLALVAVPVLRGVLVPSSGIRTFALTAATCAPGLVSSFVASTERQLTMMTPATLTIMVLNWCALSTVFSTVASSVIYGLRSEVRKARRLGQYTLISKIGEGGMGVVYLAQHALLRRRTVVKLVADKATAEAQERFEREVQLTSQLTHPNTISIYDFGRTLDGTFYYAMEYLDGKDLEHIVTATGPLPPGRVIHVLRQACGALDEAHASGLLHRDIKLSNLFLSPRRGQTDVVKVLDFGLVKDLRQPRGLASATEVDRLIGTPHYMSPEQISEPHNVDARSDIYALGAVAYCLLTGMPVFAGRSIVEVCSQQLYGIPTPPSIRIGKSLPADLEHIVLRCLEKDRESRFENVRALRDALDACRDAHVWTECDAVDWWARHGSALDVAKPPSPEDARATIMVDLAERAVAFDRTVASM